MRRSSDGILLRLGYHLIARPFGLAMLLLLRAFLPSYAATAAYGVREVVPYLDRCDRPLPRPIFDGKGLGFTWIL